MEFVIGGIILGIISGGFIGLCISAIFDIKSSSCKYTTWIISIAIFSVICACGLKCEYDNFNNGYCIKCDTKYEAITYRHGETYYECSNCHYGCWY